MKKNPLEICSQTKKGYVIGIDGGGTKTEVALANLQGKILVQVKSGPSNLRNLGVKRSVFNISQGIRKVLNKKRINEVLSVSVALAAVEEE